MIPVPWSLLPDNASLGSEGQLLIGGCDTLDLAREFGTPLFVYDEDHLRARCRQAAAAFGDHAVYASKAFLCKAMARLAHSEGLGLDVATGGELHTCLAAGVPAAKLVFHGNNKSVDELRFALGAGVGRIVVDSFDELDRLDALAAEARARTGVHGADGSGRAGADAVAAMAGAGAAVGVDGGFRPPNVLLRITPGIRAETHEFIATGQDDSKFGFTVSSGAAAAAVARARASTSVNLVGLHAHIGSQVFRVDSFAAAIEVLGRFANPLDLPELVVGGGLGVAYVEGEESATITQWARIIAKAAADAGISAAIGIEPGRAIVAAAAVTLYTVGTIKELPGIRTYISVDGGMSDNPRPVLYGSGYETFLPRAVTGERHREARVVGKHCESGDLLVRNAKVPADIKVGDILCTPVTGAYGHSMGSNYNKVPRPPVVFCRNGDARLVVRRETYDDLLATDIG